MSAPGWDEGKVLRLPFECLETLPGGLREVRIWYDSLCPITSGAVWLMLFFAAKDSRLIRRSH